MKTEEFIAGKRCFIYDDGGSSEILIQAIDKHDLEVLDQEFRKIGELSKNQNFALYTFLIDDWNRELAPWSAPAIFGNEDFGGEAFDTLRFIQEDLLPYIQNRSERQQGLKYYLGGYSLSGLFALWAGYQTDVFTGIAAASPSVWFPKWTEFITRQEMKSQFVYLSLGDKEEKAKNQVMAKVGENIRYTEKVLRESEQCRECLLEWNQGNHFKDSDLRTAKAFAWVLNRAGKSSCI